MRIVKVRIDGQEFFLPGEVDVIALRQQVLTAIARNGDFVDFQPVGYGEVSVLVTAHTKVRLEVQEHDASEVESWNEDPPNMDVYPGYPGF